MGYTFRHQTLESISSGRESHVKYLGVERLITLCLFMAAVLGFLAWGLVSAPLASAALALAGVVLGLILPLGFFRPAEFHAYRARDLEPGELVALDQHAGPLGAVEARVLLSRLNVDDEAPQVELVLAGKQRVIVLPPDGVVCVARPLLSQPAQPLEAEFAHRQEWEGALIENLGHFKSDDPRVVKTAVRLGLVKKELGRSAFRLTESGRSAANAALFSGQFAPIREPAIWIDKLIVQVGDQSIDFDALIDSLADRVSSRAHDHLLAEARSAASQQDAPGTAKLLIRLGRDLIVGTAGSGVWAGLETLAAVG